MATRWLAAVARGTIGLEASMKPPGVSIHALARAVQVPPGRTRAIVNSRRAATADTALRKHAHGEAPREAPA